MRRLLISAGEPSGDLYAAELLRHLRESAPSIEAFGMGGDCLEAQGCRLAAHTKDLAVVGLVEVLRHVRRLRRVFRSVLAEVDRDPPTAAVLVDYPDFHLRLARQLKRRGVPVVYYVSPQVWAWRRGRIAAIRECVSHMIVIFPFEEALYRDAGVPVTFVGHPLVDLVRVPGDRAAVLASCGLDPARPLLLALPGSRRQEVAHNLPPLADGLRLVIARRPDVQLALAVAPHLPPSCFESLRGLPVARLQGRTHELMGSATVGVVASGTATVEAALLGLPMLVVYRLSRLTYALGRAFVSVPHYAMANLIAGREIAKELIQNEFTGDNVAGEALRLLGSPAERAAMREALAGVRRSLGGSGASERAAAAVMQTISRNKKS